MKRYLILILSVCGLSACYEPSKTQETNVPVKLNADTANVDTNNSTTKKLAVTYKAQLSDKNNVSVDVKEKIVKEMLAIIPEVSSYSKQVDSVSKGKTQLIYTTVEKPNKDNPYYYIKIDEKTEKDQITKFQFYVDPNNFSIKVYDPTEDIMMDLDDWQKNGDGN